MRQASGYTKRRPAWHTSSAAGYTVRLFGSVAAVLGLLVALVHLPATPGLQRVGWDIAGPHRPILPEHLLQLTGQGTFRAPQSRHAEPARTPAPVVAQTLSAWDGSVEPVEKIVPVVPLQPILEMAEQPPTVRGGIGAYYIHIEYPADAIAGNIEGGLVLEFVVEPHGQATNVTVVKSLYPSCDSSAVQALRKTHFVPGRQNGKEVRVRMSLPVRFVLLPAEPLADNDQSVDSL